MKNLVTEIRGWYNNLTNLNRMWFVLFVIMNAALSINPLIIYNAPIVFGLWIILFFSIRQLEKV